MIANVRESCLGLAVLMWAAACSAEAAEGAQDPVFPGATAARGTVFLDKNANGLRDGGEEGLPGVRLTARHRTAATDDAGIYEIRSEEPFFMVSVDFPAGTWPTEGWFRRMESPEEAGIDFPLRPCEEERPFVFVHLTDMHMDFAAVDLMLEECRALPVQPRFYICTGDMRSGDPTVQDLPDLERTFGAVGAYFRAFPAPLFMVPGNHDTVGYGGAGREALGPEDLKHPLFGNGCWERYVCPARWAFSHAGVRFVGVEYAVYSGRRWEVPPAEARAWLSRQVNAAGRVAPVILAAHNPSWGEAVEQLDLALGLFGHTHTEGLYFPPGQETPRYGQKVLITGILQRPTHWGNPRRNQDGRPPGYRIVAVGKGGIHTFYKALGEPHTILVNRPRRFVTLRPDGPLDVAGQFFDPAREARSVTVRLGRSEVQAAVEGRLLWGDFEARFRTAVLPEGFYDISVGVEFPEGSRHVAEPYLILTGKRESFTAVGPAALVGKTDGLGEPAVLVVNGQDACTLPVTPAGETVTAEIPPQLLRRLNRVTLHPADGRGSPKLSDVRLRYDGATFHDQHRAFTWGYQPSLSGDRELYFDLQYPGPPVHWAVEPKEGNPARQ